MPSSKSFFDYHTRAYEEGKKRQAEEDARKVDGMTFDKVNKRLGEINLRLYAMGKDLSDGKHIDSHDMMKCEVDKARILESFGVLPECHDKCDGCAHMGDCEASVIVSGSGRVSDCVYYIPVSHESETECVRFHTGLFI